MARLMMAAKSATCGGPRAFQSIRSPERCLSLRGLESSPYCSLACAQSASRESAPTCTEKAR
eukprot:7697026-Pyramimonas_sp.AAC.1